MNNNKYEKIADILREVPQLKRVTANPYRVRFSYTPLSRKRRYEIYSNNKAYVIYNITDGYIVGELSSKDFNVHNVLKLLKQNI